MPDTPAVNRRSFLQTSAAAGATVGAMSAAARSRAADANQR
ncbi:MAG: twin-arginine translocation signal domain-containing protein, partial [Planctomycetales bacterium]|nr:twin-arginine translocation signal domain-containing protein [Planctomycetales bacterium]